MTKLVTILGGSGFVGRYIARRMAQAGWRVRVATRRPNERLYVRTYGFVGQVEPVLCNIRDEASVRAAIRGADAVVNCAGIPEPPGSSILTVSAEQFRDLIDVHLGTVFATCRAAAPKMVARGRGAIVNTSSFAFLGDYGGTGYPAGKGAVNGLTLAIAAELAEHGVRANVVCPGARTRLSTGPEYEEQIHSLQRRGMLDEISAQGALDPAPPEYVAPMYAYLVSDLAAKVTGQIFIAAGNFVGRFDRPSPTLLGYRDHHDSSPWTVAEIAAMLA